MGRGVVMTDGRGDPRASVPVRASLTALPDWSAVPSESEDDRALLGQRLAYFGGYHFLLSAGFLVVFTVFTALRSSWEQMEVYFSMPGLAAHLVAALLGAGQWLVCRRGSRSSRALNIIDAGGLAAIIAAYSFLPVRPREYNPGGIVVVLLIAQALVTWRASVVPATARRTAWITAMACVPMVIITFNVARTTLEYSPDRARALAFYFSLWSATIVGLGAMTSRVIYGLQQRVRDATQVGQYTLEEKVGEGGMGVVYRARHALLRRATAIKLLPPERAGQDNLIRFEREVQQTSRLTHPNTVSIYDYGHTADGVFYYAMEYLDGLTLEQLIEHDGPQPPGRVISILRQVCGALAEAHASGLIHRDIKPANLLLGVRGGVADHVTVLDFGLVKQVFTAESPDLSLSDPGGGTAAGVFVGTPLYVAPETIAHRKEIDARTDLYSLGAVAYFLLTGQPPFDGATLVEVCSKHLHATPEPMAKHLGRSVPADLEALVLRCLAKDPDDRPASAGALEKALAACSGAAPWSADDADRWWSERAPAVRAALAARRRGGGSPPDSGPRTLAVDAHGRGDAPTEIAAKRA
jgi:eukaryotic-like serine/threonine-protein kinase